MKPIIKFITERLRKNKDIQNEAEGISVLDKISNEKNLETKEELIQSFVKDFVRPNGPSIYAFVTDKVKDAIKVGYTDQHPDKRIAQWKEIYGTDAGEVTCLGYWSSEEFNEAGERVFFWDHAVHKKISDKGYKQLDKDHFMDILTDRGRELINIHFSREFFSKYKDLLKGNLDSEDKEELSAELIQDIIIQMKENIKKGTADFKLYSFDKEGKTSTKEANKVWDSPNTYKNTELQEEAIKNGIKAINDGKKNILMAAVMRFGKTHATYEIIKEAGLKRVIVCSAKADVRKAWRDDINHIDFYKDFVFVEVLDQYNWDITSLGKDGKLVTKHERIYEDTDIFDRYEDKTIILFFTLHDLSGSINAIKSKHRNIFDEEFDIMVVDETHYGSHANAFGKVTKLNKNIKVEDNSDFEEEEKIAKDMESFKNKLNIKYKTILQVSGTPYYILASNEMIEDDAAVISKVSYTDMLNARDKWDKEHANEDPSKSPYFGIPTLHKIGLRLTKDCRRAIKKSNTTDSLTTLFEVKSGKFRYEKEITELIRSLFGDDKSDTFAFLKNKSVEGNKVCKHTIMVLPRVEACKAMEDLLHKMKISRDIIRVVDKEGKANKIDIESLNNRLLEDDNKDIKSIVLTVNRYLTGVSMPLIDSMIYLKNASSPQEYDQNIFRLCTRNVKKVSKGDNEEGPKYVNMKDNVYLIDFNISNMFNMLANSAKMRALADAKDDKNVNIMDRIAEYMKEDLKNIPLYCEDGKSKEITGKMKVINSSDLMEIYANYNKDKSIADVANDEINLFDGLFGDRKFQEVINSFNIEGDKSKINIDGVNADGEDSIDVDNESGMKSLSKYAIDKLPEKKLEKITKEKFKSIVKGILYCNITLDNPYTDIKSMIDDSKNDDELREALKDFKITVDDIEKVYDIMSPTYKESFDYLLLKISYLAHEIKEKGSDALDKAMRGLGKIDKSEVVTPPEIVNKMIDKLDESDYKNAESILLINEKQGEFFKGLIRKFGKEIGKKCKIVCSSSIGERLTKKMLKTEGFNDYIDKIIMSIGDINGDGKYTVNDFLDMQNEDILKENNGKKFDIVLMNPPYAGNAHLKFLDKVINISNTVISIQPDVWLNKSKIHTKFGKYREKLNNKVVNIEHIDHDTTRRLFNTGNAIQSTGIFLLSNDEKVKKIDLIKYNFEDDYELFNKINIYDNDNIITFNKCVKYTDKFENIKEKYIIPIFSWHGGKDCYDAVVMPIERAKKKLSMYLVFNSENEINNFKESLKTKFMYWYYWNIVKQGEDKIKVTMFRLKDYSKPITNEDFYNIFNLSKQEIDIIEHFKHE